MWRIVLVSLAGVVLLLTGWLLLERHRAKSALARYEQQLRAKGEKLTYYELAESSSPEQNQGAELYRLFNTLRAGAVLPANGPPLGKRIAPGKILVAAREKEWLSHDGRMSLGWEQLEADLKSNANQLDQLRKLLQRPALEFPVSYIFDRTLLPHLAYYKRVAEWISTSALDHLHSGRPDAAIDDFETLGLLTRPLDTEPFVISQTVRIMVATIALNTCWEILQSEGLSDSQLVRLHTICERFQFIDPMIQGIGGDRAFCRDGIREARSSHAAMTNLLEAYAQYGPNGSNASARGLEKLPYREEIRAGIRSVFIRSVWRYVSSYDDERHALEEGQLFIDALRTSKLKRSKLAMKAFETAWENKSRPDGAFGAWDHLVTGLYMPRISNAHVRPFQMQVQCEMTIAAIALKRYHLRYGKYPKDLAELVPEFLREVPVDWMDGQKLRYRADGEMFVLWSVGEDGKDDGGKVNSRDSDGSMGEPDLVWPQPASEAVVSAYRAKGK